MMTPLPLADRYQTFRESVFSGLEESATLGFEMPMAELDLQSLWFAGAFGNEFTSTDGKAVKVVDFGVWNSGAGPDFMGCTILVGGTRLVGDIELDTDARDWERHGHGANADYAGVVLHLFLQAPEQQFFTRTMAHREVVQVQLTQAMLTAEARPNRGLAAARLGRCAVPLLEMEEGRVQSIIECAAQYRLGRKSLRLHRSVEAHGREQAIFQALAQTLGYRNNQSPFLLLSQRLPLEPLLAKPQAVREALLFGLSTFLPAGQFDELAPDVRGYVRDIWAEWWRLRDGCERWLTPQQSPQWKLSGTRPGNHPQRRLGALAAMLEVWTKVAAPLLDAGRWSQIGWREVLLSLQHDFWSRHYTLFAQPAKKPVALIGETRVQEMLANVAYPLLLPERTRLWAEYLELPAMLDNQKLRRAALRLFGESGRAAEFQKKLHQQQGLLQLYEDFCLEDESACADCPFPERIKEWR